MNFKEHLVDGRRRQVVVIDRSPSWAESLARLVRGELEVDARWYTPVDLVDAELGGADVVVLGGSAGLEELRHLASRARAHNPGGRIVVLAADADVRSLRQDDEANIEDVLSRDATAGEFVRAVQCLLGGARLEVVPTGRRLAGSASGRLTHAEARVLEHIAAGMSNEEIATWLGVSTNTVRTHVQRVTGKLGADSRLHAAALARETGMLDGSKVTVRR